MGVEKRAEKYAASRKKGAPLQYVLGETCFYGFDIKCDPEPVAQRFADAAADLYGRALTPHGTAAENGEDGGYEDQERHFQRDIGFLLDAFDDRIRAAVVFILKKAVKRHDDDPGHRQEKQDPGIVLPQLCGVHHAEVEQDADQAHDQPHQRGQQKPAQKLIEIIPALEEQFFVEAHKGSSFVSDCGKHIL